MTRINLSNILMYKFYVTGSIHFSDNLRHISNCEPSKQSNQLTMKSAVTSSCFNLSSANSGIIIDKFVEMAKRRSFRNDIILSYFDLSYLDFAMNFYETSLKRLKITNFIFIVSCKKCCTIFNQLEKDSCIEYNAAKLAANASIYGSPEFIKKMNVRTELILLLLEAKLNVLHSDVDVYFVKNPLNYINCRNCDIATLVDRRNLNAGFVYVKPTIYGKEVYVRMKQMAINNTVINDQVQLNTAIHDMKKIYNHFKHVRMDVKKFLCGKSYFEIGSRNFIGDNPCHTCVVIHNNFISTIEAKEYRAKENGLWDYDGGQYFSSPHRKYLAFDNPCFINNTEESIKEEHGSLQAALAISSILNRTLILPAFHCKLQLCSFISLFHMQSFHRQFGNTFRENSFLKHKKVPETILQSRSKSFLISTDSAASILRKCKVNPSDDVIHLVPRDKYRGATDEEVYKWFGHDNSNVLQFHSLYNAFYRFTNTKLNQFFLNKINVGLKQGKYTQL